MTSLKYLHVVDIELLDIVEDTEHINEANNEELQVATLTKVNEQHVNETDSTDLHVDKVVELSEEDIVEVTEQHVDGAEELHVDEVESAESLGQAGDDGTVSLGVVVQLEQGSCHQLVISRNREIGFLLQLD